MFWKKKVLTPINSDEYEKVLKRILEVESRISGLELSEKAFKDKVLRKLSPKIAEIDEETGEKDQIPVKDYRFFGGGR